MTSRLNRDQSLSLMAGQVKLSPETPESQATLLMLAQLRKLNNRLIWSCDREETEMTKLFCVANSYTTHSC